MNKNVERLYNGIIKENFRTDAWYVSDTCGYILSDQRTWNGTFHNRSTYFIKPFDLSIP